VAPAAIVPTRRVPHATTPIPALPPPAQHEHGTRRAGAIANGTIPPPPNTISVHNLHWYLPEHLVQYADILPTPDPIALEARSSRVLSYLPRNHFTNQKYGPFTEDRDEKGKLMLPEDPGSREVTGNAHTQLEPPARVRYPAKRITTAEIRKRVRNMLEYVSKVQSEESKRKQRAEMVGIDVRSLGKAIRVNKDGEEVPEENDLPEPVAILPTMDGMDGIEQAQEIVETPTPRPPRQPAMGYGSGVTSDVLMDELMRDLIAFQESFATGGGFGGLGGLGVSPLLPSVSAFGSAPPTPAMPGVASVPTAPNIPTLETTEVTHTVDLTQLGDLADIPVAPESPELQQDEQPIEAGLVEPEVFTDISEQEIVTSPSQIMVEFTEREDVEMPAEAPVEPEPVLQEIIPAPEVFQSIEPAENIPPVEDGDMTPEEPVEEPVMEDRGREDDGMDFDDLPIPTEMTGTDELTKGLLSMPSMPASHGSVEPVEAGNNVELPVQSVSASDLSGSTNMALAGAVTFDTSQNDDIKSIIGEVEPLSELETPVDVYREGQVDEVLTNEDERFVHEQRSGGIGVGMLG